MDGGAWYATVYGVAKSWTRLSDFTFSFFCLELWPSNMPGDALSETLFMALCSHPSPGMPPPTFLPGRLHPSLKPQLDLLSLFPQIPGSHFFLIYLYFLQLKHFGYSLPILFLSIWVSQNVHLTFP